jgi:S1-C subfamily serine protease
VPTDDDGDDDAVGRMPPPPPDDRLWRHPSEVSAFGPERLGAAVVPVRGAAGRSPAVWPIALVAGLVGAALCGGVLALTGNLSVEGDRAVERVKVTPLPASSYIFGEPSDADALAQNLGPSVVRLLVTTAEGDSQACGVVLRDDGVVVTSAHEIAGATAITVALSDGRTFEGELVGVDLPSDVGVLSIDASGLTVAVRGTTEHLQAGARAMVVGTTRHGEPAVATGVVSAMRQRLDVDGESLHGLIQTDVPVETGWSGGPLVDETGAVIGITTDLGGDGTRFGFATPIELVHRLAEELLLHGKVAHGWLGIEGADLTDTGAGVEGGRAGAQVMRVMPGSPADESGLQVGDIIIEVGGEPIRSSSDLVVALRGHQPGDRMVVRFWRGGQRLDAEVTIDHHPDG